MNGWLQKMVAEQRRKGSLLSENGSKVFAPSVTLQSKISVG
jgi:hypothetical protein